MYKKLYWATGKWYACAQTSCGGKEGMQKNYKYPSMLRQANRFWRLDFGSKPIPSIFIWQEGFASTTKAQLDTRKVKSGQQSLLACLTAQYMYNIFASSLPHHTVFLQHSWQIVFFHDLSDWCKRFGRNIAFASHLLYVQCCQAPSQGFADAIKGYDDVTGKACVSNWAKKIQEIWLRPWWVVLWDLLGHKIFFSEAQTSPFDLNDREDPPPKAQSVLERQGPWRTVVFVALFAAFFTTEWLCQFVLANSGGVDWGHAIFFLSEMIRHSKALAPGASPGTECLIALTCCATPHAYVAE